MMQAYHTLFYPLNNNNIYLVIQMQLLAETYVDKQIVIAYNKGFKELIINYEKQIREFVLDQSKTTHRFENLDKLHRKIIHRLCERYRLQEREIKITTEDKADLVIKKNFNNFNFEIPTKSVVEIIETRKQVQPTEYKAQIKPSKILIRNKNVKINQFNNNEQKNQKNQNKKIPQIISVTENEKYQQEVQIDFSPKVETVNAILQEDLGYDPEYDRTENNHYNNNYYMNMNSNNQMQNQYYGYNYNPMYMQMGYVNHPAYMNQQFPNQYDYQIPYQQQGYTRQGGNHRQKKNTKKRDVKRNQNEQVISFKLDEKDFPNL